MGAFTDYLEKKIIEHFLQGKAVPAPATVYVGLFTSDPGEGTGGTETNYTGYARQKATWSTPGSDGKTKNANDLAFPANKSAADVTLTHMVIFDAVTGGNRLFHSPLSKARTLSTDDNMAIAVGALEITLD